MSKIDDFQQVVEQMPRRRRTPSPRNLQIYEEIRAAGRMQHEVAARLGVCQQRISAIVRQVERWRAERDLPQLLAAGDNERGAVEERLQQGRLEQIYQTAIRGYERPRREVKSVRKRSARRGEWSEQTVREWVGDPRMLKAALRTLAGLGQQKDQPAPPSEQASWLARSAITVETLVELRREAAREGRVPRDPSARRVVERLLRELTGTDVSLGEDVPDEAAGTHRSSDFCRNDARGNEVPARGVGATHVWPTHCIAGEQRKYQTTEAKP